MDIGRNSNDLGSCSEELHHAGTLETSSDRAAPSDPVIGAFSGEVGVGPSTQSPARITRRGRPADLPR
jgi:hypothetical protein